MTPKNEDRGQIIEIISGILATLERESMFASSLAAVGGIDFADVRPRVSGDPYKDIDWPRTIVTGNMHVRLREQERGIPVCFALDISDSLLMSGQKSKRAVAADLLEVLSQAALRRNCILSYVLFSDRIEFTQLHIGHPQACKMALQDIADLRPHAHKQTDMSCVLQHLTWVLKVPTLVFILSDFLCPSGWQSDFDLLVDRNEVIPLVIEDPRDLIGPPGFAYCRGIESGTVRAAYGGNAFTNEAEPFFEGLKKNGTIVWARFEINETQDSWYQRMADMFSLLEEHISIRSAHRRQGR
ncbi:MAG: DUF58 domain-containing protein [Candidatus Sungbacteria bacterium]|nr:DUF58 domain-containing protein [bacterium]MDZ4260238.1 DUF58 domain-containing protein [Candidatus Sungbacteria bacterium]